MILKEGGPSKDLAGLVIGGGGSAAVSLLRLFDAIRTLKAGK